MSSQQAAFSKSIFSNATIHEFSGDGTMALDPILKPRPFGGGNIALWLLKYNVEDERFIQIFADFSKIIRRSELACERAMATDNPDYADAVSDTEADYLEEIIGASFVVLQAKIRRVREAFSDLGKHVEPQFGESIPELTKEHAMQLQGAYKGTAQTFVQLVWEVANFYKHRDEWDAEVWEAAPVGGKDPLRQARLTRERVGALGITQGSTGNLRTAYEFFGVQPYSDCEKLASEVQAWADAVLVYAKSRLQTLSTGTSDKLAPQR